MKHRFAFAALALVFSASAKADTFIPSGPGTVLVTTSGNTTHLQYDDTAGYVPSPVVSDVFTYTATATSTGSQSVTYLFTGNSGWSNSREGFSYTDSTGTTDVVPFPTGSNGPFSYSGNFLLNLVAGQDYTFTIRAGNYDSQHIINGDLALTPAVVATPEPSSLTLLGTGALTAVGALRRRVRNS